MKHIVIVGGGAAGLISAIYAKTNKQLNERRQQGWQNPEEDPLYLRKLGNNS